MTKCHESETGRVHRYRDGELTPEAAASFEAHLVRCQTCRETLADLQAIGNALRDAFRDPCPAAWPERFVRRTGEIQLQRSRRIAWGLVAAASLLLAGSLSLVGYSWSGETSPHVFVAQWEEEVITTPPLDEEYVDMEDQTLVAIHVPKGNGYE